MRPSRSNKTSVLRGTWQVLLVAVSTGLNGLLSRDLLHIQVWPIIMHSIGIWSDKWGMEYGFKLFPYLKTCSCVNIQRACQGLQVWSPLQSVTHSWISRLKQDIVQVKTASAWFLGIGTWLVCGGVIATSRQVRETVLSLLSGGVACLGRPIRMSLKSVRVQLSLYCLFAVFFSLRHVFVVGLIMTCPVKEANWVNLQKVPIRNHTTHWLEPHSAQRETECCYCHWQQEVTENQPGSYWKQPLLTQ